jgi:hypothetical protein
MTKKDFELITATLKANRPRGNHRSWDTSELAAIQREQWTLTAIAFSDALKETNKQFNRDKFLHACGVS